MNQYKGGHPGTVMGAAAIGVALWRYHMKYNPKNPDWVGRDRESPIRQLSGWQTRLTTRICPFRWTRMLATVHHAPFLWIH
jgi:hypothetical protein